NGRDLIKDFQSAGFGYAATKTDLDKADPAKPLLGLFAFSNMNVALDKINGRRGTDKNGLTGASVVEDFGLPDQPMLDEMAAKAIDVLKRSPK
ncbi:alkaline phosphatase, partial [Escherichia coli]